MESSSNEKGISEILERKSIKRFFFFWNGDGKGLFLTVFPTVRRFRHHPVCLNFIKYVDEHCLHMYPDYINKKMKKKKKRGRIENKEKMIDYLFESKHALLFLFILFFVIMCVCSFRNRCKLFFINTQSRQSGFS